MTSKRQVTIPKAVADDYGISAGDEIEFEPAGDAIRVQPPRARRALLSRAGRLERFDRATERERARRHDAPQASETPARGWHRDDLYERGSPR